MKAMTFNGNPASGHTREQGIPAHGIFRTGISAALAAVLIGITCATASAAKPPTPGIDPVPGAIFTTDSQGVDVNQNTFYATKADVYLNGGPKHNAGAAGLADGDYYVQVTAPSGSVVLGKSIGPVVHVTNGVFAELYQLVSILKTASSGFTDSGYDDTPNRGGEYKVWVSKTEVFDTSLSKTDNFKVNQAPAPTPAITSVEDKAILHIVEFYDANANGIQEADEPAVPGWLFHVSDDISLDRYTVGDEATAEVKLLLAAPGTSEEPAAYVVHQADPSELSWVHSTSTFAEIALSRGDDKTVFFGNVSIGQRGGHTLGFWSNKNGQKETTGGDLSYLSSLNLRNPNGFDFDPSTTAALSKWLLSASATNMANMLSAQLATMAQNIRHPEITGIRGGYILYRPELIPFGVTFNSGFITIDSLITAANASLKANGNTTATGDIRTYQDKLKTALDDANNNKPFYVLPPDSSLIFSFP